MSSSSPIDKIPSDARVIDVHGSPIFVFPDDVFTRFTKLEGLNLASCSLKALPPSLYEIPSLRRLNISNNSLSVIPVELGLLQKLESIDISQNPGSDIGPFAKFASDEAKVINFLHRLNYPRVKFPPRQFTQLFPMPLSSFTIMSYNILAPHCIRPERFPFCPNRYLDIEYRLPRILDLIRTIDTDVICLQEVEGGYYRNVIEPQLRTLGYVSLHCPKARAIKFIGPKREIVHGQATFVRTSVFDVLVQHFYDYTRIPLAQSMENFNELSRHDEVVLISLLRHKQTGAIICVCNVHLFWESKAQLVRISQLHLAIEKGIEIAREHAKVFDLIICGDFNSNPRSKVMQYLSQRGERFVNSYNVLGIYPKFTQYAHDYREPLDYICSTCYQITPNAVLAMDDEYMILENYWEFPADQFPSDHLPLATRFQISESVQRPVLVPETSSKIQISKPKKSPSGLLIIKKDQQDEASS